MKTNHLGKQSNFVKPITKTDKNAHFGIVHYAGTVSYNVTGWLEKNKDPLNDTMVEIMKNGSNKLIVHIFADHPGKYWEKNSICRYYNKKASMTHKVFEIVYEGRKCSIMKYVLFKVNMIKNESTFEVENRQVLESDDFLKFTFDLDRNQDWN